MDETDLSLEFLRVVEQAAIASARTMGRGDAHAADRAAVDAMRHQLDRVPIDGTIVIGEGERDDAPMLFIGERVGAAHSAAVNGRSYKHVDIAVDPLEGTNLCATGASDAITVLAAGPGGSLLHAPDLYMEKLIVGSHARHAVSLDAPAADNLAVIARGLDRKVLRSRGHRPGSSPSRDAHPQVERARVLRYARRHHAEDPLVAEHGRILGTATSAAKSPIAT